MDSSAAIYLIEQFLDWLGVLIILIGVIVSCVVFLGNVLSTQNPKPLYKSFRQNLSRVILLGLEILIAGDIIHSVAVSPTIQSVLILGVIVLIRLVLTWELEMEIDGYWPWQAKDKSKQRNNRLPVIE